jgi:flagellar motor switch protein FliN
MAAAMLGMEPEEIEETEVKDVILEMSNIVGGNLKSGFNDAGMQCHLGTPLITLGEDFEIETLNMVRYEPFAFKCGENFLFAEVWVKPEDDASVEVLKKLTSIDIKKFGTLDIISMTGDKMIELFETMLSMRLELTDPSEKLPPDVIQIVSSVSFAGDTRGSLNIQVDEDFARLIAGRMMNKSLEEVGEIEEVKDVIGEVANIIGGNLKSAFCDAGLESEISPPSITAGHNFKIEILNMARYERFAFQFYDYRIAVEVCVKIDESSKSQVEDTPAFDVEGPLLEVESSDEHVDAGEQADAAPATEPQAEPAPELPPNVSFLLDVPLEITVELGRTRIPIDKVLNLGPGSIVELKELDGEPVNILANNNIIARGELVVVHEKYGVRIKEIISRLERIKGLK